MKLTDEQWTEFAVAEQFLLFCSKDEFLQIARAIEAELGKQAAGWLPPGPVTPEHPLECLIVVESLRQSDGDWWVKGFHFFHEHEPVAWLPDTPENRARLMPAPPAGTAEGGE